MTDDSRSWFSLYTLFVSVDCRLWIVGPLAYIFTSYRQKRMPEGPSLIILKEEVQGFKGKKVVAVSGNSKQDIKRLEGKKITDFKSWGKHFLICFPRFTIRIHFL